MGNRISEHRKDMKFWQKNLAELAEVSPQLLSTTETWTEALRPKNPLKIIITLVVSVDYLPTGKILYKDLFIISYKLKNASLTQEKSIKNNWRMY